LGCADRHVGDNGRGITQVFGLLLKVIRMTNIKPAASQIETPELKLIQFGSFFQIQTSED
jgi:hypothetical protein